MTLEILVRHRRWLANERGGKRMILANAAMKGFSLAGANLEGAILLNANLDGADLGGAIMVGINLKGSSLMGAFLMRANMENAELRLANLADADLRNANLAGAWMQQALLDGANLDGADLRGADLNGARIDGASLDGAIWDDDVPIVEHLDRRVADAVGPHGENLSMAHWHHPCGTAHCRAGWAIALAGWRGIALEMKAGRGGAASLIYARSTGRIPDFYESDDVALAKIRAAADKDRQGGHAIHQ